MEHSGYLKTFFRKLKDIKNTEVIMAILIIAIIISIYTSTLEKPSSSVLTKDNAEYRNGHMDERKDFAEDPLELKLKKTLSNIRGAGRVEVMITYRCGREIVTAVDTTESSTVTEEKDSDGGIRKVTQVEKINQPVTLNDSSGSRALVLKEIEPEIKGVIVIAEGAGDIRVRMELTRAVQTVLGVNANQVEVFVMEQNRDGE